MLFAAIETRWLKVPPNIRGILWLVMGSLAFSINDLFVKSLGQTMSPFQLAFFRYAIGFLIMAPVFLRMGAGGLRTSRPGIHAGRLVLACIAQVGVYASVVHLPLADATALAFSRILFTTIVAVIVLREVVSGGRWTATFAGFVGVVVMVRPGGEVDPVAFVAIGAACTFAVANVLIRLMSTTEPPNRILFYYQAGGIAVMADGACDWHSYGNRHDRIYPGIRRRGGKRDRTDRICPSDLRGDVRLAHIRRSAGHLDGCRRADHRGLHQLYRPDGSRQ